MESLGSNAQVDERGFVNLEGEVPNLDIMRKAVEAAAQVPGVRAVDTDMELERFYAGYAYPYGYYPAITPMLTTHTTGRAHSLRTHGIRRFRLNHKSKTKDKPPRAAKGNNKGVSAY